MGPLNHNSQLTLYVYGCAYRSTPSNTYYNIWEPKYCHIGVSTCMYPTSFLLVTEFIIYMYHAYLLFSVRSMNRPITYLYYLKMFS